MESKARALGHPIHPMLIVFPLGLLSTAVIFDLVHFLTGDPVFAQVGFWNITAGVVGGLLAGTFGLVDWLGIPRGTRAKRIGMWHGLANAAVLALFVAAWVGRVVVDGRVASVPWFVVQVVALAVAASAGWLGGELVDRLGVGVDPEADVNMPSSLANRPGRAPV